VRAELELTLGEPAPDRVLTRLGRLGAFRLVLPGYRFVTRACARVGAIGGRDPGPGVSDETRRALVWLALTTHLGPEAWTAWADRLRLPPGVRTAVARARAEAEPLRTALARARTPRDAYRILRGLPEPVAAWAHVESEGAVRRYIAKYLGDWRGRQPRLTGDELVALGVAPGPALGQLLRELVAEEIAGRVRTRAAATRWVRRAVGRAYEWKSETSE
jgi:tRNA nucleotidyltransferase (CCA-adding enzyme)